MAIYEYHDRQAEESEERHQRARIDGPAEWSAKHGGACPYCGSHDGYWELWPEHVQQVIDLEPDLYQRDDRDDVLYMPCSHCLTAQHGYKPMTVEQAQRWLLAQDGPTSAYQDSRDAAEGPAIQ